MAIQFNNPAGYASRGRQTDKTPSMSENRDFYRSERAVKGAVYFIQHNKQMRDKQSWIQKSLGGKQAPSASTTAEALTVLQKEAPDIYKEYQANLEKVTKRRADQSKEALPFVTRAVRDLYELKKGGASDEDVQTRADRYNQELEQRFPGLANTAMDPEDLSEENLETAVKMLSEAEKKADKLQYVDGQVVNLTKGTVKDVVGIKESSLNDLSFTERQSLLKAASKLPDMNSANNFLRDNTGDMSVGFKTEQEFLRAQAAYKSGKALDLEVTADGGVRLRIDDAATGLPIGRTNTELGIEAQDRNILTQISDFENHLEGLRHPKTVAGIQGRLSSRQWIGIIAQLPGGPMGIETVSRALGSPIKPDEFAEIKTARAALSSILANARAISRGVQDDRNASPSEAKIAAEILKGLEAGDDYATMIGTLELVKDLANIRTASLGKNQKGGWSIKKN